MESKIIEVRFFVRPELCVLYCGNDDFAALVNVALAGGYCLTARAVESPFNGCLACHVNVYGKVGVCEAVVKVAVNEDIADVCFVSEKKVYFAENTGHTPHILVFEICTVGPFQNENLDFILPCMNEGGYVNFACHVADLAVRGELIVYPYVESGVNALEIEVNLLACHSCRNGELTGVKSAGVFVGNKRRVVGDGIVYVCVVRNVIAASESHLPAHGNGEFIAAFGGKVADVVH